MWAHKLTQQGVSLIRFVSNVSGQATIRANPRRSGVGIFAFRHGRIAFLCKVVDVSSQADCC